MTDHKENTRRIAKNSLMLYVRMFFLMLIGLYTSRVVLNHLGISNYGIYNAVAGLVTAFTIVSGSVTQTIVRYISFSLGEGDDEKLRRVFSTSVIVQCILASLIFLMIETVGQWFLYHEMSIPDGRMDAAVWVLHCSAGMLVFNLLAIPYNASITAHEDMSAFAWISIVEGILKLLVAFALSISSSDSLKIYAVLMLAVAIIVRLSYTAYSKMHYPETRGRLVFDRHLIKDMTSFAGWNFLGSGTFIVNTQGINLLSNVFFGVAVNAARGVALQVESIVKQLVSGFLTALNPQIIKSYANSEKEYCFSLVFTGIKFSFLAIWLVALPLFFEADTLLALWLGDVPENAPLFLKLSMFCLLADMVCNPIVTLVLATKEIKEYYIVTGLVSMLAFVLSWLGFRYGLQAWSAYVIFALIYGIVDIIKVRIAGKICGFPVKKILILVLKIVLVASLTASLVWIVWTLLPAGWIRFIVVLAVDCMATFAAAWIVLLNNNEKSFIKFWKRCR